MNDSLAYYNHRVENTRKRMALLAGKIDLSKVQIRPIQSGLNKYNIDIKENHGLNSKTGYWWLRFTFDYRLEEKIEVRLTNYKKISTERTFLTMEIVKCDYLKIKCKDEMESFDVEEELANLSELCRVNESVGSPEKLRKYLEDNILPLVMKKIKYTKFNPQFSFFLSHKSKDKPLMETFRDGLKFVGYQTWLDKDDMPIAASLRGALKVAIEKCDCFIVWLNEEYFESNYCQAELLYARKLGKIILPFGVYSKIKDLLKGDFEFLVDLHLYDPSTSSFFEVLRRIDEALFNFEMLTI